MPAKTDLGRLTEADWNRLETAIEGLEQAWASVPQGSAVKLGRFLPDRSDELRLLFLFELIKSDLEIRWRRNQPIVLEDYVREYPDIGTVDTLPIELVYEELRVRQRCGDDPPIASYKSRFPKQYDEFVRQTQSNPTPTAPRRSDMTPRVASSPRPSQAQANQVLQLDGNYMLVRRIGQGSFGEVWRAEAPGGVEIALKMLVGAVALEEARRELQALAVLRQMRHVFLLPLHAFWRLEDRLIIAMELADGSLRARLTDCRDSGNQAIPVPELIRYMTEASEALNYLHDRHVLHRDVKPENLLTLEGHIQVADFGLSRVVEQTRMLVTTSGGGTPAYTAPEVFWQGKVGPASDQYSLAASYVELRLGHALFRTKNYNKLMKDHLETEPELGELASAERAVVHRALAKEPGQRFPCCREFAQELSAAVTQDD